MNERQDAYDLTFAFGDEIVRSETKNIAEDGPPTKTMKKCTPRRLEDEPVPRGAVVLARRTDFQSIGNDLRAH